MRTRSIALVGLHLVAAVGLMAQGQDAPPQFWAGVELITLDVTVLDDNRQPVRGLTDADFTVLEDGVGRPIRAFTAVELAAPRRTDAVWAADVPVDVVTNQAGEQDGRLVVILMDRSIPVERATLDARKIATATVDQLGAHDLGAVVSTGFGAVQNFTADRTRLLRAINYGDPSTGLSPEQEAKFGKLDPLNDGRCLCGLCVLETITRVADAVRDAPRRRKVLFFIGSSLIFQSTRLPADVLAGPSNASKDPGCESRLKHARDEMFAAVDRANLTVHSIDPQGLMNVGPQTRAGIGGGFDRPVNSGPAVRLKQQQDDTANLLSNQLSLQVLTARTGGRTVVNRNDPQDIVPAIFRESEAYYVLGVERGNPDRPEGSRAIDVKVKRRGLRVIAQRQYLAPSRTTQPRPQAVTPGSSEEVLNALLPRARLPLALTVNTFASPDDASKAVVRVSVDASAFAQTGGTAVPLEVAVKAVDPTGRPVAAARQTSMLSGAGSGDRPAGVTLQSHLELPPGDYGIRVAVTDTASGTVASVFSDVTVPKYVSAPLSLSDVAVELANGPGAAVATTRRVFRHTDRVRAVMQIYQGTARSEPLAPVSVRVEILDAQGRAVRDQSLPFAVERFSNRRADCVMTLPIANLPAGAYLLKLDASIDRQTSSRALRFAVE
jgi:VWFA-related protein